MITTLTLLTLLSTPPPACRPASQAAAVASTQTDDCQTWEDCRDQAIAAADREEFERFHDLAWRAVQKGPRNDAALLTLLARAQSLSGRPHDALVMLRRLATMGVVTDAADSDDFRRVRALPGWTDLQGRIADTAATRTAAAETREPARPMVETAKPASEPGTSVAKAPPKPAPSKAAAPVEPERPKKNEEEEAAVGEVEDALRFTTLPFEPAGLVYDAVSNRFIIGDRRERKLSVIGERSQRIANLAGEVSAGFGQVEAIAIDAREGDLWVASTPDGDRPPKLHKLQLISGRLLRTATLPEAVDGARLTDIAVTGQGVVFALDSSGRRLFRLNPGDKELEAVVSIDTPDVVSIAPSAEDVVYVAGREGIARIDAGGGEARSVEPSGDISLAGLQCIRWHRGAILGIQQSANGLFRIIRIRLAASGRRATRVDLLESDVSLASPSAIAVADDALFYLGRGAGYTASGGMDITIRRVKLR